MLLLLLLLLLLLPLPPPPAQLPLLPAGPVAACDKDGDITPAMLPLPLPPVPHAPPVWGARADEVAAEAEA